MGEVKRYTHSPRLKAPAPLILSPKFAPTALAKYPRSPEYFDATDLRAQYQQAFEEVQALLPEVHAIRQIYLRLKDEVFLKNRGLLDSEIEYARQAPALNAAVGRGAFTTAIGGLSAQNRDNHSELVELREQLAPESVAKLQQQVLRARVTLAKLRSEVGMIRNAEKATRHEIVEFRREFPPERTQAQRDMIREIIRKIRVIEKQNEALNNTVEELEAEADRRDLPVERQIECDRVTSMETELVGKRREFCDRCNELIEIKGKQVVDVSRANAGDVIEDGNFDQSDNVEIGFDDDPPSNEG
jgi:hypothetical protein